MSRLAARPWRPPADIAAESRDIGLQMRMKDRTRCGRAGGPATELLSTSLSSCPGRGGEVSRDRGGRNVCVTSWNQQHRADWPVRTACAGLALCIMLLHHMLGEVCGRLLSAL